MAKPNSNLPAELAGNGGAAAATEPAAQSPEATADAEKQAQEAKAASDKKATDDKAAAEKKTEAAKAAAEKKAQEAQAAAVKAATNVPSDAMMQRIENNAAAQVNAGPKVTIFLTPQSKEDKRAEVIINGHSWKIKKGEWVSVPKDVAEVLRQSEKVLEENERLKGDLMVFN